MAWINCLQKRFSKWCQRCSRAPSTSISLKAIALNSSQKGNNVQCRMQMPSDVEFHGIVHSSLKFLGEKPEKSVSICLLSDDVQNWLNISITGEERHFYIQFTLLFDSPVDLSKGILIALIRLVYMMWHIL